MRAIFVKTQKMNYAFLSHILAGHWMMTPETALASQHLLNGLLQGLHMEESSEDPNKAPYMVDIMGARHSEPSAQDEKYISVISLTGTVLKHDGDCGAVGTRTIANRFRKADEDPSVMGHILVVESGGGLASAVPEMADTLSALKKPVVAWIDGVCGSAAYYIASYCQKIIASHKEDQVGCIGVMIGLQGSKEFHENKDGYVTARIYSSLSNEKNRDYEEALKGNFNLIREYLDPMAQQFQEDVRANRQDVKQEHLLGRTFRAEDVVGSLIDSIGPLQSAIDAVVELANNNHNTNSTMEHFENLQALEGVGTLEADAEGMVTLNQEQLQAVETALQDSATIAQERDSLQAQLTERDNTIAERDTTIASQQDRITELEALVKTEDEGAEDPAAVIIGEEKEDYNPMNECLKHIENFS